MKLEGKFNTYKKLKDAIKANATEEEYRKFMKKDPDQQSFSKMPKQTKNNWDKWQIKTKRELKELIAEERVGEIRS